MASSTYSRTSSQVGSVDRGTPSAYRASRLALRFSDRSRLSELRKDHGPATKLGSVVNFERYLLATRTDHLKELRFTDRKAIHNLKYFTWVEQQHKTAEELDALWSPYFWQDLVAQLPEWDEQIAAFNRDTGVLDQIPRRSKEKR